MRSIREILFPDKEPTFRGDPDDLSPEQLAELGLIATLRREREILFPDKEPTFRGDPDDLSPEQLAELGLIATLRRGREERRTDIQGMFQRTADIAADAREISSANSTQPTGPSAPAVPASQESDTDSDVGDKVDAIYVDVSGQEPEKSRFDLIDLGSLDKQDE